LSDLANFLTTEHRAAFLRQLSFLFKALLLGISALPKNFTAPCFWHGLGLGLGVIKFYNHALFQAVIGIFP